MYVPESLKLYVLNLILNHVRPKSLQLFFLWLTGWFIRLFVLGFDLLISFLISNAFLKSEQA